MKKYFLSAAAAIFCILLLGSHGVWGQEIIAWGWNGSGQCDVPSGNDFVAIESGLVHSLTLKLDIKTQIENLTEEVCILEDEGVLNQGEANSLISKLENALNSFEEENIQAARNQLGAFINQVDALISSGRLTPEKG